MASFLVLPKITFGRVQGRLSGRCGRVRGGGRSFGRGKRSVQCYNCNRFGHYRSECQPEPQANAVVEQDDDEDECRLFMAHCDTKVWFIGRKMGAALFMNKEDSMLWHCRYGHLHEQALQQLSKEFMVTGLSSIGSIQQCEGCIFGKQTRRLFPTRTWCSSYPLQLVHEDLVGPM
ncbi:hypothetical protein E3N88_38337 [Mikania micrantha]|uniref:CCHC-type domain-containing protein n=1 Tax=Mikania micrantha TaxID=192012 RepID=A0A5N6LTY7_9ASTR|nr:hypothetical protein E3N88_38337 [Mikania micrantha]